MYLLAFVKEIYLYYLKSSMYHNINTISKWRTVCIFRNFACIERYHLKWYFKYCVALYSTSIHQQRASISNVYFRYKFILKVRLLNHSLIRGVLKQKVASLELIFSQIMYFVIHNSVVLSKILKIVVPFWLLFVYVDYYQNNQFYRVKNRIFKILLLWHNNFQFFW